MFMLNKNVMKREHIILNYRGKPAVHPEPIKPDAVREDDPFYSIDRIAEANAGTLKNSRIDRIIYNDHFLQAGFNALLI